MSTRYPTVRQGYDPTLVESDLTAMERAHQSVLDDAAAKIAALELALDLANHRSGGKPDEAQEIVSSARKEAFQLITEARIEAGLVVAEARTEAVDTEKALQSEPATELRAEELRLEARIVELQATLAGLELGIRSLTGMLATSNPPQIGQPIALEGEAPPLSLNGNGGSALVEPLPPLQRTFSPPPPPPPPEPEPAAALQVEDLTVEVNDPHAQAPAPDGGRVSFYSRRSAQLPHIGAEAGHNALSAATDLRASMGQKATDKRD